MITIPFNKPFLSGNEIEFVKDSVLRGHISGDGHYTRLCQSFFQQTFGFGHSILTTSCTDALEMVSLLLDLQPGDEVILPSFSFVSTATAFALRGAKIVFADSRKTHPNIDETLLEPLITPRTKAIVLVHYAGMACEMDGILAIARKNGIRVVEDAAQAFNATYKGRPLGGIGDFGTLSFHETKNIVSGEGGMLLLPPDGPAQRAEILRDKGTNRSAFFRGEVDKYRWVDLGSSFLPSDMIAAFLYGQLQNFERIQALRLYAWQRYAEELAVLERKGFLELPCLPPHASNNGHIFYLVCHTPRERDKLLEHIRGHGIGAVIHYQALHQSPFYLDKHDGRSLPNAERYADCLLRLPLYSELSEADARHTIQTVLAYHGLA